MARQKSELLRVDGQNFNILKKIVETTLDAGGSDTELLDLLTDRPEAKERLQAVGEIIAGSAILSRHIKQGEYEYEMLGNRVLSVCSKKATWLFLGQKIYLKKLTGEKTSLHAWVLEIETGFEDQDPQIRVFVAGTDNPSIFCASELPHFQ